MSEIPYGLCECGCGERAPVATGTNRRLGWIKGKPKRYVHGHQVRARSAQLVAVMDEPNPSGLCQCGCGAETPLASSTRRANGDVRGKPLRYLPHHSGRAFTTAYAEDADGCWIWKRYTDPNGYGQVRDPELGRATTAHRFIYERLVGPIPEGHHLHHLCGNPSCVNPAHLEPLTPEAHGALHCPIKAA